MKECIPDCSDGTYKDESYYTCRNACPSGYINEEGTKCVSSDQIGNCFYISNENPKKCYSTCPEGNLFHNNDDKICRPKCSSNSNSKKYYKNGEYTCYDSCEAIFGTISYLFSELENGDIKCFSDESQCINNEYKYLKENQCLEDCPVTSMKVEYTSSDTGRITSLGKCFEDNTKCKDNRYYFYNTLMKRCWFSSCPSGMKMNELDANNIPKVNDDHDTCVSNCRPPFLYLSGNICKENCSPNEYYDPDSSEPYKCLENCGSKKIDANNKCVNSCTNDYYYINSDGNEECIQSPSITCKDINKYKFPGEYLCYDRCKKIIDGKTKYYFYNSQNECLESCKDNSLAEKFGEDPIDEPKPCINLPGDKFYYENDHIIRGSCELYDESPSKKCVTQCSSGIANNRICISGPCPDFFVEKEYTIFDETHLIKECISNCKDISSNYKTLLNNKECKQNCPANTYEIGDKCINICSGSNTFIDPSDSYNCKSNCGTIPFYEKLSEDYNNIYICKTECGIEKPYKLQIGSLIECLSECPQNNNCIENENECKSDCDSGKLKILKEKKLSYNIYECLESCPGDGFYSESENLCYEICLNSIQHQFSLTIEDSGGNVKRKCDDACSNEANGYKYYKEINKICLKDCDNIIDYDGHKCVEKCEEINHLFEYENKCIDVCPTGYIRYSLDDYKCKEKCLSPNNYVYENICKSGCESTQFKKKVINGGSWTGEYECIPTNENLYYYDDKILLSSCENNDYVIQNQYKCGFNCNELEGNYHYYEPPDSGTKTYPVNSCVTHCPTEKSFLNPNNHCSASCDYMDFTYYKPSDKICLRSCPNYSAGFECLESCESPTPFSDQKICVEFCPEERKYYIGSFNHEESDRQKKCLEDCTSQYPYYIEKEITISSGDVKINYECQETCQTPNVYKVTQKIGKLCISKNSDGNGCPTDFPYISQNGRECYFECPTDKYYINSGKYPDYNGEFLKRCLSECPPDYYFHEEGSNECIKPEDCISKIADYESRTCKIECSTEFISEVIIGDEVKGTICLNECNEKYGVYSTPDKKCVLNCPSDKFLINGGNGICECENLYYFTFSKKICIDPSIDKCENSETVYKIRKSGTNECIKNCENILSVDEDICYNNAHVCEENTHLVTKINGQKKCDCMYKYYYDNNKKQCLSQNEECPRSFFIPETNGCVDSCGGNSSCNCPKKWYAINNKEFICYNSDNCPTTYPLENQNPSNQCLKTCRDTPNNILDVDKCVSSCDSGKTKTLIDNYNTKIYQYADYTCQCNFQWYYDISTNQNICDNTERECSEISPDFKYIVKKTKECVSSCPDPYSYIFNNECLHSCELYQDEYYIETVFDSKICKCKNLWKLEDNKIECIRTFYCPDGYVQIYDTKQCLLGDVCPSESPLFFNKICYKRNNCPQNSHFDSNIEGICTCDNLWYKYHDSNINYDSIFCLPKDTNFCPMHSEPIYPYQILRTKECVTDISGCPENSFAFNYICYENDCPLNTTNNEIIETTKNIYDCKCDTETGYWYRYPNDESHRNYLKCGLEECKGYYFNLYEEENECINNCGIKTGESGTNMVAFRGICYDQCPQFTKKKTSFYECEFYELSEAENLDDLRNYANIQVRELYNNANIGGYLFESSETSLQIYGIDKNNNINNKNLIMKSNLAYIDLGTCTKKIFEDNHLSDNDKILVIKYDMQSFNIPRPGDPSGGEPGEGTPGETEPDNSDIDSQYLINPVEYEFFSSITGEKIDASTCEPKEIIISYPFFYTLNKFNSFSGGINSNEIQKKFDIGKELNHNNKDIDIFNFNNSVYKDVCTGVEINGKDLVLEDRYENLYLNNITLCEDNCTYYYTDYELGRINCKCNYKEELDFYRKYSLSNDLINDKDFTKPTQSGANGEIMKCLGKLPGKDSIIKNEAFYYSLAVTAVEASMIFVAVFHGIKAVSGNIASLMNKQSINLNSGNKNQNGIKNYKNDNIISTSNRPLNNPPRKTTNITKNEEDKKSEIIGNIINSKNIEISNYNKNNNNIYNNDNDNNNEENENDNINYGLDTKNYGTTFNNKLNNSINNINNKMNLNGKAEFMPIEYNFKYFKSNDKGVIKKVRRNDLLFKVNPKTKYILERKEDVNYEPNYLDGPFLPNQNIIQIIDDETVIKLEENKNIVNKNNYNNATRNNYIENSDIKEKKRNISNNKEIENEKGFITIKKINPNNRWKEVNFKVQDYKQPKEEKSIYDNTGLYTLIKMEQTLLRASYTKYLEKNHSNILSIFLAEIMDKIYLLKICCFLKKFELFSVHLSLYLICHLMLLTLLCGFFTIKTIKEIWNSSNFPQLNFYLLYGFLGNIIIWIIYKIFLCLLDIQDKVKELIKLKHDFSKKNNEDKDNKEIDVDNMTENNEEINEELIQDKYNQLIKRIKITTIIFFIIGFALTIFCFIYLVSFFAIYTGTKSKVLKMYLISLVEIILIKIIYGICLAALRIGAEGNEIETIYKIVYLCDKYLS